MLGLSEGGDLEGIGHGRAARIVGIGTDDADVARNRHLVLLLHRREHHEDEATAEETQIQSP